MGPIQFKRGACIVLAILTTAESSAWAKNIRVLLDQAPATLNPRATLDAAGQRLNMFVFAALTRIQPNLDAGPDLAESWRIADGGKTWIFKMRPGVRDHAGDLITAEKMRTCLEEYRTGLPISPLKGSLPKWIATEHTDNEVTLRLSAADPYLARNVSLLRYFRAGPTPCTEPKEGETPIASGPYRYEKWGLAPERRITLVPTRSGLAPLEFVIVQDDNTKAIRLIRGEVDVIQNGISLSKTNWIRSKYSHRFNVIDRDGVSVSYLAFNVRDPILSNRKVRRAIALAIDRASIVQGKLAGYSSVAGSFLAPLLPESTPVDFPYDRDESIRLLEEAGYRPDSKGVRLKLRYKTTPIREGIETALMVQDMLGRVGIKIQIDVVEPAVFQASTRKGAFQLFSSRWLGVADGSILYNTLHTGQPLNRVGFSDPEIDRILDEVLTHSKIEGRKPLLAQVQKRMMEELPYFPLWFWNTTLITSREVEPISADRLSASGALEPLSQLRWINSSR